MNSVNLIGRIASDIQYIPLQKTRSVRKFALVFRDRTKMNGEDDSYFIECEAWDSVGELVDKYAKKGERIAISGRLIQSKFLRQDGTKSSQIKIVVSSVEFIEPRTKEEKPSVEDEKPIF